VLEGKNCHANMARQRSGVDHFSNLVIVGIDNVQSIRRIIERYAFRVVEHCLDCARSGRRSTNEVVACYSSDDP